MRKNKRVKKSAIKLLILCLVAFIFRYVPNNISVHKTQKDIIECQLLDVIDGDTISVLYNGQETKVRMIGIDAPESVHPEQSQNNDFGIMASEYTKQLLENTAYVYLEFDTDVYDPYERLLAYVYQEQDSTDFKNSINYRLVSDGYALNKEYEPNTKYSVDLLWACKKAELKNHGLWKLEAW